jgi:hypothetical protein
MAEFTPSELPPEQPSEPDSLLDMEIAPRDPQADELDRPGVAERLAGEKEFQAGVTEFTQSDLMSDEDKLRLLMQGGEAMGRLMSRLFPSIAERARQRRNLRLFVPPAIYGQPEDVQRDADGYYPDSSRYIPPTEQE